MFLNQQSQPKQALLFSWNRQDCLIAARVAFSQRVQSGCRLSVAYVRETKHQALTRVHLHQLRGCSCCCWSPQWRAACEIAVVFTVRWGGVAEVFYHSLFTHWPDVFSPGFSRSVGISFIHIEISLFGWSLLEVFRSQLIFQQHPCFKWRLSYLFKSTAGIKRSYLDLFLIKEKNM